MILEEVIDSFLQGKFGDPRVLLRTYFRDQLYIVLVIIKIFIGTHLYGKNSLLKPRKLIRLKLEGIFR